MSQNLCGQIMETNVAPPPFTAPHPLQRSSSRYGLPSTHTMGSLIPLFLAACHLGWNSVGSEGSMPKSIFFACLAWSGVIAVSRLYMGVSMGRKVLCYSSNRLDQERTRISKTFVVFPAFSGVGRRCQSPNRVHAVSPSARCASMCVIDHINNRT